MNVGNETWHIKEFPYMIDGERIVGDFISANQVFNEIDVSIIDSGLEVWYLNRNDQSLSVCAYANGEWEIEYRYITFSENTELSDSDYTVLTWVYDKYIVPKILRITYEGVTKVGSINGYLRGSLSVDGKVYEFDNRSKWPTPIVSLDGSILSTPAVSGVAKYKVYSNGSYIGYVDESNEWHGEVE